MRWPRAGIVVGVIGLVLLGAGWWLAAIGSAGPAQRESAHVIGVRPGAPLLRALQQYLAQGAAPGGNRLRPPVPRYLPAAPNGGTCDVAAGGFCSLQPCILFAGSATGYLSTSGIQAVVVRRSGPGAGTCRGHPAPARTLRVAGF